NILRLRYGTTTSDGMVSEMLTNKSKLSINPLYRQKDMNKLLIILELKKSGVLQYLSHAQADIVFLQETHIGPRQGYPEGSMHVEELQPDYMWAAFTVFRKNSRGVAILFKRDLACEGFCITGDPKGRYLIITCHIWGKQFIFINVYNPTDDKIDFGDFHDLLSKSPPSSFFVLGGDFNTVLEAQFDKTSNIRNRGHKNRLKGLQGFLEHFNLLDVWRYLYPEEKSFTYYDIKGKSRLDYFFIPYEILRKVNDCKIHARPQFSNRQDFISDHLITLLLCALFN
uniref:exodeoxyribonuclease III n=1 Tax=Denticeps clupeoides TaxID=299321 RepID=A0AAY4EMV2_9TELE